MHQAHNDKKSTQKKAKRYIVIWYYLSMGDEELISESLPLSHKKAVDVARDLKLAGVKETKIRVIEYKEKITK
jgi:hypothetical protein